MTRTRDLALTVSATLLAVVFLAGVAPSTATQEQSFDVNISVPEAVDAGADLNVSATITNRGPGAGNQTVTLTDGSGKTLDTTTVTLNEGESTTVTLRWENVPEDARTISPTVKTETEVDAAVVTVRWSRFQVSNLEPPQTSIFTNQSFDVSAKIRNVGTVAGEQNVTLTVGGSVYAIKENVSIERESFTTVQFTGVDPELSPGTYSYTVSTQNGSASGTVTIKKRPKAVFTIADIQGSYENGTARVKAVIQNEGTKVGTQPVTISVDGKRVAERLLTIGPGKTTTLTYTHRPDSVPINVTVKTDAPDAASVRIGEANIQYGPRIHQVSPQQIGLGETVRVTYTASGENLAEARLLVYGPNGSTVFEKVIEGGIETQTTIPQSKLDPYREGSYDVRLRVTDQFGGTATHTLESAFSATTAIKQGPAINSIAPTFVKADETLYINYTATGRNIRRVQIRLTGPDGKLALNQTVPQGVMKRHAIEPADLSELTGGPYTVTVEMLDAFGHRVSATRKEAVRFGRRYNPNNGNFGSDDYQTVAGDFVQIDVTLNEINEAYILIGQGNPTEEFKYGGPLDVLHVSGSTSFVVNTRLLGTDRPGDAVYIEQSGSVTSYAHDLGAKNPPTGVFKDLRFETPNGKQVARNLSAFRRRLRISGAQRQPLQPGTFAMALGAGDTVIIRNDSTADFKYPLDRAQLTLSKPSIGNITTYRIPKGNADELSYQIEKQPKKLTPSDIGALKSAGIKTNNITVGERVLVGIDATGMWGSMLDILEQPAAVAGQAQPRLISPEEFRTFLKRTEGITLTAAHTNPGPNTAQTEIDLLNATTDDVSILLDPYFGQRATEMGRFYILMDTRSPGIFGSKPEAGERFQIEFSYNANPGEQYTYPKTDRGEQPDPFTPVSDQAPEQFPYFGPNDTSQRLSTSFVTERQFLRYNRTTAEGRPIVTTSADTTISGMTNYLPGDRPVRIVIDVRDEPTTVNLNEVKIGPNGRFTVSPDLARIDPDDEVWIEFWAYEELIDERRLAVFEDTEKFSDFEITDLDTQTLVRKDTGPILNVTTRIENTGALPDNVTVELLVDGEIIANKTARIANREEKVFSFPEATEGIEPGQHTVEIRTQDDLEGTTVVVEQAQTIFEVDQFSLSRGTVTDPSQLRLSATIVNTGTISGAKPVELLIDGEVVSTRNRTLLVDSGFTANFTDSLLGLGPGNYTLTVRTPDDQQTRPLVIRNATTESNPDDAGGTDSTQPDSTQPDSTQPDSSTDGENGDPGDSNRDSGPSDPGGVGGIVGVGAGSRAVVGGTAIVGAVYVLGYWV